MVQMVYHRIVRKANKKRNRGVEIVWNAKKSSDA